MAQTVRIFLKPAGEQWIDMTVPDNVDANAILANLKMEGYLTTPRCAIPASSVHLVLFVNTSLPEQTPFMFHGGQSGTPLLAN